MAALVTIAYGYPGYVYAGFVALAFLPPVVWLRFYLHEDRHPEPKHLLLLTFLGGVFAALAAVYVEIGIFGRPPVFSGFFFRFAPILLTAPFVLLLGVSFIEETLKYLAVRVTVLRRPEFDEPIDAMVYMVTAALGFAAIENIFFLVPAFEQQGQFAGLELTLNRFFGANLLHALSSALVGYAIARHSFSPWRKHAIAIGIVAAGLLHALFNYFIITKDVIPGSFTLLVFLLALMAITVFVDFERLKRQNAIDTKSDATGKSSI